MKHPALPIWTSVRLLLPLGAVLAVLGLAAAAYMAALKIEESQLREEVLLSRYEGSLGAFKGFEAFLLRQAVKDAPGLADEPARVDLRKRLARVARENAIARDIGIPIELNVLDVDGFKFRQAVYESGACVVAIFVPAYLTGAPGIDEDISWSSPLDAGLCDLLNSPSDAGAHPRQAYYISPRGWLRLVRTRKEQATRVVRLEDEFRSLPNANLADRPAFRASWSNRHGVISSPPYVDTVGTGIVVTESMAIESADGKIPLGMIAVDVELFSTRNYLGSVEFGVGPSFLGASDARFVDCNSLRASVASLEEAAICTRVLTESTMRRGPDRTLFNGDALLYTVPVGPSEFVYYSFDPGRLSLAKAMTWALFGFLTLVLVSPLVIYSLARREGRDLENIVRQVFTSMPGGLVTLSSSGTILMANAPFARQLGMDDVQNRSFPDEFLEPSSAAHFRSRCNCSEPFDMVAYLRTSTGQSLPAIVTVTPIEHRRRDAWMAVILPLERIDPILGSRFINEFAHALKTPAHALVVLSEALAAPDISLEKRRRYQQLIAVEAGRFREMVNNLLDFARFDLGVRVPSSRKVEVRRLLRKTIEPFLKRADHLGLDLRFTAPRALNAVLDEDVFVLILSNLLENALKYTDRGRIHVEIALSDGREGRALVVRVSDTGVGIPKEDKARIFERLARGRTQRILSQEGLGLGLYLIATQIRNIGGSVEVESTVGTGSTFTVRFPQPEDGVGEITEVNDEEA